MKYSPDPIKYRHKQTIRSVQLFNPKIAIFLLSAILFTAAGGAFLTDEDRSVISTEKSSKLERKAEFQAALDAGNEYSKPNLDYYFFPRTYNADRSISTGIRSALTRRRVQTSSMKKKSAAAVQWYFAGPDNIGGRIRVVKYHPDNPAIMYAGSAGGGVFKSTDEGVTWRAMSDFLPTLAIGHLALDPQDPETVYIGTGEGSNNWDKVYGDGLYRSTDGGETWENIMKDVVNQLDFAINHVAVHPTDRNLLFVAATYGGRSGALYRSSDGGGSWRAVVTGPARTVLLDPTNPDRVIVGMGYYGGLSSNGIYISETQGERFSFTKISVGLPLADSIGNLSIDASLSSPGTFVAVMQRATKYNPDRDKDYLGTYTSIDYGQSWQRARSSDQSNMRTVFRGQGDYNLFVRIHPTDPDVLIMGGINTWRSTNFGDTWKQISFQSNAQASTWVDLHYGDFNPSNPDIMFVASDGGVYRSVNIRSNSVSWVGKNKGLATMQFYAMDYDRANPERVAGGTQDRRNNIGSIGDAEWRQLGWGGDGGYFAFDYKDRQKFYLTSQYGNLGRTTNGGASFSNATMGLIRTVDGAYMFSFVTPFIIHPTESRTLFVGGNKIYRTDNSAALWRPISDELTGSRSSFGQMQDLALCLNQPDVLYCVSGSTSKAFRSTNVMDDFGDVEFEDISNGLPRLFLASVAVDPFDADVAYIGTSAFHFSSGVYKTTNGGQNWIKSSGSEEDRSLPEIPVGALAVHPTRSEVVFAGTDIGVYVSYDAGENWEPYGEGLPTVVIDDLKITDDNALYVATHGRGLWMTTVTLAAGDVAAPNRIDLEQNYPNPFNPSTTISFALEKQADVRLSIFDLEGREVRILLDTEMSGGSHSVVFDAGDLNSGMYLYKLESGGGVMTKKMMLLK